MSIELSHQSASGWGQGQGQNWCGGQKWGEGVGTEGNKNKKQNNM